VINYLNKHKRYVLSELNQNHSKKEWEEIYKVHQTKIQHLQHERLIHLLVTLFMALFWLISLYITISFPRVESALLNFLLLGLLIPYIFHYRKLENGVQNLYKLSNKVIRKIQG